MNPPEDPPPPGTKEKNASLPKLPKIIIPPQSDPATLPRHAESAREEDVRLRQATLMMHSPAPSVHVREGGDAGKKSKFCGGSSQQESSEEPKHMTQNVEPSVINKNGTEKGSARPMIVCINNNKDTPHRTAGLTAAGESPSVVEPTEFAFEGSKTLDASKATPLMSAASAVVMIRDRKKAARSGPRAMKPRAVTSRETSWAPSGSVKGSSSSAAPSSILCPSAIRLGNGVASAGTATTASTGAAQNMKQPDVAFGRDASSNPPVPGGHHRITKLPHWSVSKGYNHCTTAEQRKMDTPQQDIVLAKRRLQKSPKNNTLTNTARGSTHHKPSNPTAFGKGGRVGKEHIDEMGNEFSRGIEPPLATGTGFADPPRTKGVPELVAQEEAEPPVHLAGSGFLDPMEPLNGLVPGAYAMSSDHGEDATIALGSLPPESSFNAVAVASLVPETPDELDPESFREEDIHPIDVRVADKPYVAAMKDRRVQFSFLFVALAFIAVGVGLGVGLGGNSGDDSTPSNVSSSQDSPTPAPSPSPTKTRMPTMSPSRSFAPTIPLWTQVGQSMDYFSRRANFGFSVSLSDDGTRLAAGGPHQSRGIKDGRTFVRVFDYHAEKGEWVQIGPDIVGDTIRGSFGKSVFVSGNRERVAVGAPFNAGYAKVFQYEFGKWMLVGNPIVGAEDDDKTGQSVALSQDGNILAVGSDGYVDVYEFGSRSWKRIGERLEGITHRDKFGASLDMSADGHTLAIGATKHNGKNGQESGKVSVFTFQNNSWTQMGSGQDLDGAGPFDAFGRSVSLSTNGMSLAVGADEHDGPSGINSGHARIFRYDAGSGEWNQMGDDINGLRANDYFGSSVSLSADGSIVAVGGYRYDVFVDQYLEDDSGQVRVFGFEGNGWEQIGDQINGQGGDQLGRSLSLSQDGSRVAVGSNLHDPIDPRSGEKVTEGGQVLVYEFQHV